MPDVTEVIIKYLEDNGYDGLYSDECGCELADLMPCGSEGCLSCEPGYYLPCNCGEGCDFHIGMKK